MMGKKKENKEDVEEQYTEGRRRREGRGERSRKMKERGVAKSLWIRKGRHEWCGRRKNKRKENEETVPKKRYI